MKIIDAGHTYDLDCLDGDAIQRLFFVKREGAGYPFNSGHRSGTNCQEVIRALIDRTEYLNRQIPCAETESAAALLRAALLLFELRAARNHNRHLDCKSTQTLVSGETCKLCGHIGCSGEHKEK